MHARCVAVERCHPVCRDATLRFIMVVFDLMFERNYCMISNDVLRDSRNEVLESGIFSEISMMPKDLVEP